MTAHKKTYIFAHEVHVNFRVREEQRNDVGSVVDDGVAERSLALQMEKRRRTRCKEGQLPATRKFQSKTIDKERTR